VTYLDPVTSRLRVLAAALVLVTATAGCTDEEPGDSSPQGYERYVSLGDSFTGAPGVPVTELTSGCARSDHNYPSTLAAALGARLTDVSCGAASTAAMTQPQQTELGPVPPQLDALRKNTDLVTLGIGVNDAELFATLFTTCVALRAKDPGGSPCRDSLATAGGDRLTDTIATTEANVTTTLEAVRERSPDAEVLLIGYPQIIPGKGTCDALPLADGDYAYARDVWAALVAALERAAEAADVSFVDLFEDSEGRDMCAGDRAWVNGAVNDPKRAASFHPFAVEQRAVAELVLDELEGR